MTATLTAADLFSLTDAEFEAALHAPATPEQAAAALDWLLNLPAPAPAVTTVGKSARAKAAPAICEGSGRRVSGRAEKPGYRFTQYRGYCQECGKTRTLSNRVYQSSNPILMTGTIDRHTVTGRYV